MSAQDPSTKITLQVDKRTHHDLRTPLNQIIGYSEMLAEEANSINQGNLIPDLQKINQAAHKMLQLVEDLFFTENADSPQPSTFTKHEGALAVSQEPDSAKSVQTGRILVVDDNELNRDMLSRRLQRQGHQTELAENGRQALEMLRDKPFDLVLLDIMMPEMDGYAVLARMKGDASLRNIPIIMISAITEMDSVVKCIEMGAEDYLPKPFNPTLLKARISACLEKKRARDREMQLFDQVQQNYKRLQELEKQRDDLTHMIVHDLRTPLTAVISGMKTLDVVGDLNKAQREAMHIAVSGGETLLGLINDLLDVEKLETGAMQLDFVLLSAEELVASAIRQVASLAEDKRLQLNRQIAPDLPPLQGDETKLLRTLINLLGNAIKFTPP